MSRLNEKLLDILYLIAEIRSKEGEPFKSRAFKNAHDNLIQYNKDIYNETDLKGISGFGASILTICNEFINTGKVQLIDDFKNSPIQIFADIYGVGPKMSAKLVEMGITNLVQLKENATKVLNDKQQLGLKYYDDIKQRIPRNIIQQYEKEFRNLLPKGNIFMEIVGSYRRCEINSGDIDVIFTYKPMINSDTTTQSNDSMVFMTARSLFNQFIGKMVINGIIKENHILASGESKCLVLAKLESDKYYRRIDFLCAPSNEYAASILYFTGSKYFNTFMRQWAIDLGYTLNEHGICHLVNGVKGALVDEVFDTEEDIFHFLGLVYKAPCERHNGHDVIPISKLVNQMRTNIPSPLTKEECIILIKAAKYAYYNKGNAIMTDAEFDMLENKLGMGMSVGIAAIKNKAQLPYFAPSLDKIKPDTDALQKWMNKFKGPYVISCKLDGCSIILYNANTNTNTNTNTEKTGMRMYSRGNGAVGQDISYLLPYLKGIHSLPLNGSCIRGELIMKKTTFESKYSQKYANIRNMIAGTLDRLDISPELLNDIDFVPYEVIHPIMKPSEQYNYLEQLGWNPVWYNKVSNLTNNDLSMLLVSMRNNYEYEIDGIVVVNDSVYNRPKTADKNPDNAFAFKMVLDDQQAEVIVSGVSWSPSKDGYLKPVVQYEPVIIKGAKCTNTTGFNAKFIAEHKIGIGAIVRIVRSGDVIPYLMEVIRPAVVSSMPDVGQFGTYHWNETGMDLVLDSLMENNDVICKNILHFFKKLEVKDLAEGNIVRLIEAGQNSVAKILAMSKTDWLKVRGFKDKMADKLYSGVYDAIQTASLVDLMSASNLFGRGFSDKKIGAIMLSYPQIFDDINNGVNNDHLLQNLMNVPGIGEKSAELFIEGIGSFFEFLKESNLENKLGGVQVDDGVQVNAHNIYKNKNIVFSGFRDKELKKLCEDNGLAVSDDINKNTIILVIKNEDSMTNTSKVEKAIKNNISILTVKMFHMQYF